MASTPTSFARSLWTHATVPSGATTTFSRMTKDQRTACLIQCRV